MDKDAFIKSGGPLSASNKTLMNLGNYILIRTDFKVNFCLNNISFHAEHKKHEQDWNLFVLSLCPQFSGAEVNLRYSPGSAMKSASATLSTKLITRVPFVKV